MIVKNAANHQTKLRVGRGVSGSNHRFVDVEYLSVVIRPEDRDQPAAIFAFVGDRDVTEPLVVPGDRAKADVPANSLRGRWIVPVQGVLLDHVPEEVTSSRGIGSRREWADLWSPDVEEPAGLKRGPGIVSEVGVVVDRVAVVDVINERVPDEVILEGRVHVVRELNVRGHPFSFGLLHPYKQNGPGRSCRTGPLIIHGGRGQVGHCRAGLVPAVLVILDHLAAKSEETQSLLRVKVPFVRWHTDHRRRRGNEDWSHGDNRSYGNGPDRYEHSRLAESVRLAVVLSVAAYTSVFRGLADRMGDVVTLQACCAIHRFGSRNDVLAAKAGSLRSEARGLPHTRGHAATRAAAAAGELWDATSTRCEAGASTAVSLESLSILLREVLEITRLGDSGKECDRQDREDCLKSLHGFVLRGSVEDSLNPINYADLAFPGLGHVPSGSVTSGNMPLSRRICWARSCVSSLNVSSRAAAATTSEFHWEA